MLALNMDRDSLFLACSDKEFHIFGPLKLMLFLRYSVLGLVVTSLWQDVNRLVSTVTLSAV